MLQGADSDASASELLGLAAFWLVRIVMGVIAIGMSFAAATFLTSLVASLLLDIMRAREPRTTQEAEAFFASLQNRAEESPDYGLWKRMGIALNSNLNFMARGNMIDTFRQSIRAAQIRLAHESCKRADLCLRPPIDKYGVLEFESIDQIVEAGYRYAQKKLEELRSGRTLPELFPGG